MDGPIGYWCCLLAITVSLYWGSVMGWAWGQKLNDCLWDWSTILIRGTPASVFLSHILAYLNGLNFFKGT